MSNLEEREGAAVRRRGGSSFDRERLDDFCSKGILGCIIAMLVLGPILFGGTRLREFSIVVGIEIVALVLWLVRIWVRESYRMLLPPLAWGLLAFAFYVIFRYQTAEVEYLAREELFVVISSTLFFFLVLDNCQKQEQMQWLLYAAITVGMAISFYAVYQYTTENRYILNVPQPIGYKGRAGGTYICPNHLAGYLEMLLPMALALVFTGRIKHVGKILIAYAALAMTAGIVFSFSRGGWVSTFLGIFLLLGVLSKKPQYRIPALIMAVVVIGGMIFGGFKLASAKRLPDINLRDTRLQLWQPAIEMWKANFWTGVGPRHYDVHFQQYRHWQVQTRPVYTHNDYLNLLADYGTIGGLIVLACLGAAAWGVWRSWKFVHRQNDIGSTSSNRSAVVVGAVCGLSALLAHSVTDFNLHVPANALLALLLLALLTIHIRFGTERFWIKPGLLGRVLASSAIIGAIGWLSLQSWVLGRESHYLLKAEEAIAGRGYVEYLNKAFRINPNNSETALRIGEHARQLGFAGDEGYEKLLEVALTWFERAHALNQRDPFALAYAAMCWHWLRDPAKASDLMEKALERDPRNHFIMTLYGWHTLQKLDLEEARIWFKNSLAYSGGKYLMARRYLEIVERRLAENEQTR